MSRFGAPGVYYQSVDAGAPPVTPFRTDIAGFVGIAERGPVDCPVPIGSWRQFTSWFGTFTGAGYLAYAVRAYFENGGRRCWVVRVASNAPRCRRDVVDRHRVITRRQRLADRSVQRGDVGQLAGSRHARTQSRADHDHRDSHRRNMVGGGRRQWLAQGDTRQGQPGWRRAGVEGRVIGRPSHAARVLGAPRLPPETAVRLASRRLRSQPARADREHRVLDPRHRVGPGCALLRRPDDDPRSTMGTVRDG